jgi:16S rRNA (cytosine967-C5)-methyltransferase
MRRDRRTTKPAPRLAALFADVSALYCTIATGHRPADYEIAAYFRSRGLRSYEARGRVAELVYAALRRAPYYIAVLEGARADGLVAPETLVSLVPFLAALDTRVGSRDDVVAGYTAAIGVEPSLRPLARWYAEHPALDFLPDEGVRRFAALHAFPEWIVEELAPSSPRDELAALLDGLCAAPPLSLRANTAKASVDDVAASLAAEGFDVQRGGLAPTALLVDRSRDIFATTAFRDGLFEVQDEGSQAISLLVGARPGGRVLDLCAGSGGKTLHLGAIMRGRGAVFAYDTDARRLSNMTRRLRRSGLQNVRVVRTADEFQAFAVREAGSFERVLVDAPCSGTGAVRRAPDIKLRATPALVDLMVAKQREVLETAARFTQSGGRIVYATCSVLPRENERIVEAFLAVQPDFALVPVAHALGDDAPDSLRAAVAGRDTLSLVPHLHGTDGFFAAVLERQAS